MNIVLRPIFLFILFLHFSQYGYSQLFISEYSDASLSEYAFIEFYNNSDESIDISGYTLLETGGLFDREYTFAEGTVRFASLGHQHDQKTGRTKDWLMGWLNE